MRNIILTTLTVFAFYASSAQMPVRTPTVNDTLVSTKILPGKKVLFQIFAPRASQVIVSGDFAADFKPLTLNKAENGVWSVVTAPLYPDVYSYDFSVDGVKTLDPKNLQFKESENSLSNIFEVQGEETAYLDIKNVPHGKVEMVWYDSPSLNQTCRMHVYTPPGYESMKGKLPVLYLQHGGGDDDASWTTVGKANFIMDNLLAAGKIKPMIVVMAMGHPAPGFFMAPAADADPFLKQLVNDIIPYIESHYKASPNVADRAFSGLSMGGLQALNVALFYPEKFAYVLPLSTGYFAPQLKELEEKHADILKNPAINKLRLFWIAMGGEKDIAYANGNNVNALFDRYGIKYKTFNYPKGHTFLTWRYDLYQFAPMLFKD